MSLLADAGAFLSGPRCVRPATGRGVLDGVRLAVKDLIDVQGGVTGGGNPDWARGRAPATADAPSVTVLRSAGAQLVGKTVTDELAFSLEGANAFHGTPRNPRAPGRLPGGSSSGSAVAVAAGLADLALGTDTGGSVRVPASFCGLWGMRPTHGRLPLEGVLPFAPSYDTVGWFARDAQLLAQAGDVLLKASRGPAASTAPLRLRIAEDAFDLAEPAAREVLLAAARPHARGAPVKAFDRPWTEWLQAYTVLQGLEIQASLGDWIRTTRPRFGPSIAPRFDGAMALDPADGVPWRAWRAERTARLHDLLGAGEAWLIPCAPCVALPVDADSEARGDFYQHALALGSIAGHAGLPQVCLPVAEVAGLPVGLSIVAAPGHDENLLALAARWTAGAVP